MLRAQGEAEAIQTVFDAIHAGNPDDKLLAYQYLQTLPKISRGRRPTSSGSSRASSPRRSRASAALRGQVADAAAPPRRRRTPAAVSRDAPVVRARRHSARARSPRTRDAGSRRRRRRELARRRSRSARAGVDYIETDAHITADGVVVLFHDADLQPRDGRSPSPSPTSPLRELAGPLAPLGRPRHARARRSTPSPTPASTSTSRRMPRPSPPAASVAAAPERVLVTSFSDARRTRALAAARMRRPGVRPATSAGTATIAALLAALATRSRGSRARALRDVDALQIPERRGSVRIAHAPPDRGRPPLRASRSTCGRSTIPRTCAVCSASASTAS